MDMKHNKWSQDRYIEAYKFAAEAHRGQNVPGTGISYIMHLSFVSMEIIAALRNQPGCNENLAVQCALLHDAMEDAGVNYEKLLEDFGKGIADGVNALTKNKTLDKPHQMEDSLRRIKQQPREIWMVKLADRITNLQPPPFHWAEAKITRYMQEAKTIHEYLGEASDYLSSRLLDKIESYKAYGR